MLLIKFYFQINSYTATCIEFKATKKYTVSHVAPVEAKVFEKSDPGTNYCIASNTVSISSTLLQTLDARNSIHLLVQVQH